jgi:HSP20 family protein
MSMITSLLGRKQQNQKGGGATEVEPVSIDTPAEPFMDAISLTTFATASMDWKETPTAHVFMADLPGVRRDEVKVEVEEKVLRISWQRQRAAEDKGVRWHRVERSSERFVRTVRLPPNANTDNVQAVLDSGVLTVTIPKDNDSKAAYGRLIPITN